MCCSSGPGGTRLTRCGVVCGLAALAALSTALLGPAWLHTEEKIPLSYLSNNSPNFVSVRFKLGLFRVCPKIVKPSNLTIPISTPGCSYVRYSSLEDVKSQELGFHQLEFTPTVVSKIRISAPFQVIAVVLIFAGTIFALIGHCYSDHRTLVACGLFLLGGLEFREYRLRYRVTDPISTTTTTTTMTTTTTTMTTTTTTMTMAMTMAMAMATMLAREMTLLHASLSLSLSLSVFSLPSIEPFLEVSAIRWNARLTLSTNDR